MAVLLAGCARPQAPTGGAVPEIPLRISEAFPEHLSNVGPFGGPVVIRFDRTLSERLTQGAPATAVVVSPQTGDVWVEASGEELRIGMQGGFQRTTVYRITVLPRFQDRYTNPMDRPFDLIFSTGPDLEPNLLAGLVMDRLTLEPARDIRVDAVDSEGIAHSTVTDSTGVFALPYLPADGYRVIAYEDLNRDRVAGFAEPQDSVGVTLSAGDTLLVTELEILAPDTTAAVLQEIEVLDSMTLRAEFDDYIDPGEALDGIQATVEAEGGGATVSVVDILHVWEHEVAQAAAAEEAQQAQQAQAGAAAGGQPAGAQPAQSAQQGQPVPGQSAQDEGPPLPETALILELGQVMGVGVTWEVTVSGVRNINGIPDGGGTVEVVREPPPAPAAAPEPDAPDGGAGTPTPDPTDPAPADPDPTDPAPADPAPNDPAPTDPAPNDLDPTDPTPADPAPTNPGGTGTPGG